MFFTLKAPKISGPVLFPTLRIIAVTADRKKAIAVQEGGKQVSPEDPRQVFQGHVLPNKETYADADVIGAPKIEVTFSPIPLTDGDLDLERRILSDLVGIPGFPQIIGSGTSPTRYLASRMKASERNSPFFITAKVPGSSLSDFALNMRGTLPQRETVVRLFEYVLAPLATRIATLHDREIIHRNVAPKNAKARRTPSNTNSLTITNFGLANWLTSLTPRPEIGEMGFAAPEVALEQLQHEDRRADVYGFGATCFALLSGEAGILYAGMENPWTTLRWKEPTADEAVNLRTTYYEGIGSLSQLNLDGLIKRIDLPSALKRTAFGKYLMRLIHPNIAERPSNMHQVADTLKQLGGQLTEVELYD
ncbi:MAG: protein kinase [Candidatus Saganbacteria bacterium]|nr:protein kinase [Candidatus Saganbacteria bacterium]